MTWRELFTIQFALQSFAPKISNKTVCWETENSTASLTVTSESNNSGSPDLLGTQSHKTFKNIQSQSTLVVHFRHSAYVTILRFKGITHHINIFSWGIISLLNRFKPVLACSLDFRKNNYRSSIDCFSLYQLPPH